MLRWLFPRPVSREQAVAIASKFLEENGCRVVPVRAAADFTGEDIPVVFRLASLPGRRWYVEFERVLPPNVLSSCTEITVIVWADTGQPTFDYADRGLSGAGEGPNPALQQTASSFALSSRHGAASRGTMLGGC